MKSSDEVIEFVRGTLARKAGERGVPAASVAVLVDGEIVDHATGVLSTATGIEATTDSIFQIGSITKVWTATLVLQLVDDGLVDLDAPIRTYVPEFHLADEQAASAITVRQLLSHQAGFEGDVFTDTGRGDDAIEKYVELLADLPQIFAPGTMFSYNNAGYVLLGRLVERMRDTTWTQALMERIVAPLGLERVSPSPYEAILHRVAVGHLGPDDDGVATPAPLWAMAPSNAPAGSMLSMTARDLVGFARMQLADGLAPDGERVLSSASVDAMRTPLVGLPRLTAMGSAWGLGWEMDRVGDAPLYGHDGNTVGQSSFLRIDPQANVAVVLLTNGGDAQGLFHDIADPLLRALTGTGLPDQPAPPVDALDIDIDPYLGVFSNSTVEMEVSRDDDGRLWLEQRPAPSLVELGGEASRTELVAFGDDSLIMREPLEGMHVVLAFLSPAADGRHSFVHVGRALARAR